MPNPVRDILSELADASLRRLCRRHDLPVGRSAGEREDRLVRAYRGDPGRLLDDLGRPDLLGLLDDGLESDAGDEVDFVGIRSAPVDEVWRRASGSAADRARNARVLRA